MVLFWKRKKSIYCWTRSRPTWTFGETGLEYYSPSKDTFHTCNLKTVLEPHFTRDYETLLRSRISTAFVVLTLHCGAKFVQCETERYLLVAGGRLATDSQSEIEQRGLCHVSYRKCTLYKLQPVRRNIKGWKEVQRNIHILCSLFSFFCTFVHCAHMASTTAKQPWPALFMKKQK